MQSYNQDQDLTMLVSACFICMLLSYGILTVYSSFVATTSVDISPNISRSSVNVCHFPFIQTSHSKSYKQAYTSTARGCMTRAWNPSVHYPSQACWMANSSVSTGVSLRNLTCSLISIESVSTRHISYRSS